MLLSSSILLLALVASLTNAQNTSSIYRKVEEYSGSSFFDGFTTYTGYDSTNGYVDYVSMDSAATHNLTAFVFREEIMASNAYVGVDYKQLNTNDTAGRKSVRLTSKNTFGVGLLTVVDVVHAPTGPGVWPAVWLLGNVTGVEWPASGEMDIMEWVNDLTFNAMTLHTSPGCTVDNAPTTYLGTLNSTDCNANNAQLGCSIHAPSTVPYNGQNLATAGRAFNAQGGGVYVLEWTGTGITVWLFPRTQIPADLANETPDPSSWTAKPLARFAGSQCNFNADFQQMQLIINIDLCGDWAGAPAVWSHLASLTGEASCEAFVASHPRAFRDAYFEFASIKMFSSNPAAPGIAGQSKVKRDLDGYVFGDRKVQVLGSRAIGLSHAHDQPIHAHLPGRSFEPDTVKFTRIAMSDSSRIEVAGYLLAAATFFMLAAVI